MNNYIIYTDGAYSSSRDNGGIGIVILRNGQEINKYSYSYPNTTNNRMELSAIIVALRAIKQNIDSLTIYSDSMYCIGCITKGWQRKKNQGLWKVFDKEYERVQKLCPEITFNHVKGHNGDEYNEICDTLAVFASKII